MNLERQEEMVMDFGCYEMYLYFDADEKLRDIEFSYDDGSIANCECGCY